ncbi:MAG: VWA domain-containing protein [Vicinamibacteria bacterium]
MTRAAANDELVRRVLDAVPARSHALGALLSLFRVEASTEVPTACVTCERRPVLRVNPAFVATRCRSDAHLFVLVMHELHHVLLGHTRLFPRVTPAHNLAFDAVVNALLCARFPEEAYTSFFTGIYGREKGPLRLLAPPGRPVVRPRNLEALHKALYEGRATADEVFHAIVKEVQLLAIPIDKLLGSHGGAGAGGGWGTEGPADPLVVDAIRRIVEKWPPPRDPIRGRSLADALKSMTLTPGDASGAVLKAARKALLGAADRGRRTSRRADGPRPAEVPLPDPRDRRAGIARALGSTPVLYRSELVDRRGRQDGAAHVYLDVSGSMDAWIEELYGALARLSRHLAPDVHLFSTRVETVPLRALKDGARTTTGGTDVRCVLEHALRGRARRVLIVSDGYVGEAPPDLARAVRARGVEVRVLLTPGGFRRDLEPLAARIEELPATDGSGTNRRNP